MSDPLDSRGTVAEPIGPNTLDHDRIAALEARILEQERADRAARPWAVISAVIAFGGIAFAIGAHFADPPVMLVLSAACALVLFGLNQKRFGTVNAVATAAMLLVQFVFVPAMTEMSRRADEATTNLVGTMVSGSEFPVVVPGAFDVPDDLVLFPTPVSIDDFGSDAGVYSPE